ncbi:hypothetical protein BDR05DRAFT_131684 [Suillus weaverae]|nr:hypothetical protein BDR05DRAFT_131684 [Suillus weaverae]
MRRCCFWECFCGLAYEHPTPVRFVTSAIGHTQVVCHFRDHRCGFSININKTRHTALLESSYDDFPTRGNLFAPRRRYKFHPSLVQGDIPNITLLLTAFRAIIASLPSGHAEIVPYFVNYLGSHSSMHPRPSVITQSLSPSFIREVAGNRRRPTFIPRPKDILLGRVRQPIRHDTDTPPHTHISVSRIEQGHMHALAAGMGISRYDAMGLTEECDGCGKWFMASALRGHIVRGCGER